MYLDDRTPSQAAYNLCLKLLVTTYSHEARTDDREVESLMVPMVAGAGSMWEIWEAAGGHAKTDVLRQAPPVYLSARLADLFRPLPPLARGVLGMAASMAPMVLAGLAIWALRRSHGQAGDA